jgi:hypothetical protein
MIMVPFGNPNLDYLQRQSKTNNGLASRLIERSEHAQQNGEYQADKLVVFSAID